MTKLNCQACADFIADYLNGELDADVRASFETHLDRCRNCRAYLEQYAVVVQGRPAGLRARERRGGRRLPGGTGARHPRRAEEH